MVVLGTEILEVRRSTTLFWSFPGGQQGGVKRCGSMCMDKQVRTNVCVSMHMHKCANNDAFILAYLYMTDIPVAKYMYILKCAH